jgi:WD40 repeat protein
VAVCDLASGVTKRLFAEKVICVAFLPDNRHAVCGGSGDEYTGVVSVWDTVTSQQIAVSSEQKCPAMGLAVTPDGSTILSGHAWFSYMPPPNHETHKEDFAIRVWRVPEGAWAKPEARVAGQQPSKGRLRRRGMDQTAVNPELE